MEFESVKSGQVYLVEEEKSELSFEMLKTFSENGSQGLCISRMFPKQIVEEYHIEDSKMMWLTDTAKDPSVEVVSPSLENLSITIHEFIKVNNKAVVLFDGIDYILSKNDFERVLRFLTSLKDRVALTSARVLIPLNPVTLEDKQRAILERELNVYQETG